MAMTKGLGDTSEVTEASTLAAAACLLDCCIVTARLEGSASMYALAYSDATLPPLAAAEKLVGLTGDAVLRRPCYGEGPTGADSQTGSR